MYNSIETQGAMTFLPAAPSLGAEAACPISFRLEKCCAMIEGWGRVDLLEAGLNTQ